MSKIDEIKKGIIVYREEKIKKKNKRFFMTIVGNIDESVEYLEKILKE